MNVSAKDLATGKEQKITITASSGLAKDEVERMVREAQSHAAEDERRKILIEARNEADSLTYSVEKTLREHESRVPADRRTEIESLVAELKRLAQGEDADAIRRKAAELQAASHKLAESLYEGATGAAGTGSASGPGGAAGAGGDVREGEVVDAETVED